MKIGKYNFSLTKKDNKNETSMSMGEMFTFVPPPLPIIKEVRGKSYIPYGEKNLYPLYLYDLLGKSAIHYAIVDGKSKMMAGDGYLFNGATDKEESLNVYNALDIPTKSKLDLFLDNPNNEDDVQEIITKISKDYQITGSFAIEVIWSMDFSRINTLKYVDIRKVRSGNIVNGKVKEYYYCRDWTDEWNYKPVPIAAFDTEDKEHYNQLIFVKNGNLDYYGEAPYHGSLYWINIDSKMSIFHLSNISNGFAPSFSVKFYQRPVDDIEKKKITDSIVRQKSGETNAGKAFIFFSDGKDLAPDIEPINVSNLDKQYIALSELAVQNILTGSQVTSPALFGIQTPGSLSQGTELQTAYNIFNKSVIAPERKKVEKVLNKILKINQIPVKIELAPFNPLD